MRTALVLAAALLIGCGSPTSSIRMGAKAATLGVLYGIEASVDTAGRVRVISISIEEFTSGDGTVDLQAFRSVFTAMIADEFTGVERILLSAMVDEVLVLVESELDVEVPDFGSVNVYLHAGATGVTQGCDLYILIISADSS